MSYEVLHGDCRALMADMEGCSVDSVVTDPPYELGFMGREWDSTGVAYDVATWAEALRVLKPGGWLVAFGGSRTYHRMACAIEDAGFEIRDQIMWIYGSGFPKGGNRDGKGTCLKPAHEPIVLARKPLIGSVAQNEAAFGTGALSIDACRVEGEKTGYPANGVDDVIHASTPAPANRVDGTDKGKAEGANPKSPREPSLCLSERDLCGLSGWTEQRRELGQALRGDEHLLHDLLRPVAAQHGRHLVFQQAGRDLRLVAEVSAPAVAPVNPAVRLQVGEQVFWSDLQRLRGRRHVQRAVRRRDPVEGFRLWRQFGVRRFQFQHLLAVGQQQAAHRGGVVQRHHRVRALARFQFRPAIDDLGADGQVVAGHEDQRLALRQVEARVLLPVLGDVVAPKSGGYAFAVKLAHHVADIAHDVIVSLVAQLRDFAGRHGLLASGVDKRVHAFTPSRAASEATA